jgi:hypothetical protein
MSFDVSNEVKKELLTRRIEQLNLEGYQHELSKKLAEAREDLSAAEESDKAIQFVISALEVAKTELSTLED